MVFSSSQEKAIAIIPKITGGISVLSSGFIIWHVLSSKHRRQSLYHRLLGGMSACDVLASFIFVLSTWPMPRDSGIFLASGTVGTCEAAGFVDQIGAFATPAYNVSLATYYYLTIVWSFKEESIVKFEFLLHALPVGIALSFSVAALVLNLFNPANFLCWIAPYPPDCKESYEYGSDANCERGDNASIYRLAFLYAHIWLFMIVILFIMISIYWTVRKQEMATRKYHVESKHTRPVANQCLLYVIAFYVTFIPGSMVRQRQMVTGQVEFGMLVTMTLLLPLQGFLNLIVYMVPRFRRYRSRHPDEPFLMVLKTVLFADSTGSQNTSRQTSHYFPERPDERSNVLSRLSLTRVGSTRRSTNSEVPEMDRPRDVDPENHASNFNTQVTATGDEVDSSQ